jgi:hypothetical protein
MRQAGVLAVAGIVALQTNIVIFVLVPGPCTPAGVVAA